MPMDNGMMGTPPMGEPDFMGGGQDSNMGGGMPPMDGDPNMDGGMPPMGGDPNMGGDQNQFDKNFDAGVEADEDEDPENYIKQLTGKLAQKLRSFNKENGQPDEALNKYAAKMVIKAAADGMSPEGRTELKKAVNTANGSEDDMGDTSSDGSNEGGDEMPMDDMGQEPMMERYFTKKNLAEALMNMSNTEKDKGDNRPQKKTEQQKRQKTLYSGHPKMK